MRPASGNASACQRYDSSFVIRYRPDEKTDIDPQKPFITSGIRVGSPAMTTRGMTELEAETLANLMCDVLDAPNDERKIATVAGEVKKLCDRFPVYG